MTLLLVMLHTGTMFAVIVYFWRQWRSTYFASGAEFKKILVLVVVATACTGVVGLAIKALIERTLLSGVPHAEIEDLFSHLEFIWPALAAAGVLILVTGLIERTRRGAAGAAPAGSAEPTLPQAVLIGAVQGLCLPFRGFSRSGATISTGMAAGISKARAEAFSFALAVVLTPPIVAREVLRLVKAAKVQGMTDLASVAGYSLLGAVIAFVAGLVALRWLSRWLEGGRWYLFGIYCLAASAVVAYLHSAGY
jgi:undecaprenyl-diphosphatase